MKPTATRVTYLVGVKVLADRLPPEPAYPFDLPFLAELDLTIREPVAFFVGENGTGSRCPNRRPLSDHDGDSRTTRQLLETLDELTTAASTLDALRSSDPRARLHAPEDTTRAVRPQIVKEPRPQN